MNRELRALARRLGIGFHRPRPFTPFWDGRALNLSILEMSSEPNGLLAHEMGHNLLARPERHRAPNYGFGPNARDLSNAPLLLNKRAARIEENLASLVGNVLVARFAPALLAESLESTYFVEEVQGRWYVGAGTRLDLQRAMRRGVLATLPIPRLSNPLVLVDFLCGHAEALLAPVMAPAGVARP